MAQITLRQFARFLLEQPEDVLDSQLSWVDVSYISADLEQYPIEEQIMVWQDRDGRVTVS